LLLSKYFFSYQNRTNEMGWAYSICVVKRGAYKVWLGNRGQELGINGRVLLKWIFKKLDWGFDGIDLFMRNFLTSRKLFSERVQSAAVN
jgi:hypothetical protein